MNTQPTNGTSGTTPTVPDDVQTEIDTDTKATSRSRVRKLLRDTYYAGPIQRGSSPEKNMGQNTSSPGSDLRRSRDGALWSLTGTQEDLLLETAENLNLIDSDTNDQYFTTKRGARVLKALDRCDECGDLRKPHYKERTVQISRYSSGKNHSLVTKCTSCDDGPYNWNRDVFPPTSSNTDDAERTVRSREDAMLYGAGLGDWMEPDRRALQDFIEIVQDESYTDFDDILTRRRKPSRLSGADTALRAVFNDYSAEVCSDFAALLLGTFYGEALTNSERGVLEHVAAGYPDGPEHEAIDTHAGDEMEPLAVIEGDSWEATIRFEATGEYVTISGTADRTQARIEHETKNGLSLRVSSSGIGRVSALPFPDELSYRDNGDLATVVAFRVVDEDVYSAASRVDQAFNTVTRTVSLDSRNCKNQLSSTFKDIIGGRPVKTSTLGRSTRHDLNQSELVKLARRLTAKVDADDVPALVERYATRELQ